jgi:hypothetical protein
MQYIQLFKVRDIIHIAGNNVILYELHRDINNIEIACVAKTWILLNDMWTFIYAWYSVHNMHCIRNTPDSNPGQQINYASYQCGTN